MAIDPRIPLMGQGMPQQPGPLELYGKVAQLQQMAQQNRLADYQMRQAQRASEEDAALRDAVAQAGGDWGAIEKTLLGRGMIGPAMKIGEFNAKRTKEGAEADKERRLATRMRIEDGAKLLFGATDPEKYARARATAIQREIATEADWPEQYDPEFVAQQVQQAQTVKDLIDQGKPLTEIGKLIEDMNRGNVPQGIGQAALTKQTTHAPAASATAYSFGQPVPVINPQTGLPELAQFNKQGGVGLSGYAPVNEKAEAEKAKKTTGSKTALEILDEAEKWIYTATGSGLGAKRDEYLANFGISTKASESAGRLKALQAALMMAQPRMEGPQSNLDVDLYREMAGKIGDPTVPPKVKKSSMESIRSLHQRYANNPMGAAGTKQQQSSFDALPDPAQYSGQTATDHQTGVKYKSDGKKWNRVK